MKLYRYICFEEFVNLFINKKEKFVNPSCWDDKYEGYSFSLLETEDDVYKMVEKMYYDLCHGNYNMIAGNMTKMWHAKWFAYAQCWSRSSRSDAMWRAYSYNNKSIRIRTTDKKIIKHISNIENIEYTWHFEKVHYDVNANKDILGQQVEQLKDSKNIYEPYFHKRRAFSHEKEYRAIIVNNNDYFSDYFSGQGIKFKIGKEIENLNIDEEKIAVIAKNIIEQRSPWNEMKKDIKQILYLEHINLEEYIEGVMVHPLAPEWYSKMIEEICLNEKINYEGISDIYRCD